MMATETLQAESAAATPAANSNLLKTAAFFMGLDPADPAVADRVQREENERAVLLYASGAVRAAMDALAALDAINFGELFDHYRDGDRAKHEAGFTLLRLARRRLREAVGTADHPGYDTFLGMLSAHGLDIYDD